MEDEAEDVDCGYGLEVVRELSERIGPRPPGSEAERRAGDYVAAELAGMGLSPAVEEFRSGRSFGPAYGVAFGLALGGGLLQRVRGARPLGYLLAALGAVTAVREGRFMPGGIPGLLRRRASRNVSAAIAPTGEVEETVCVVSHMDASRSGLMFHPGVTPYLGALVGAAGAATLLQTAAGALRRIPGLGPPLVRASQALVGLGLALVVERELRGEDVPGANDNASGVGACLALAASLAAEPLERTRVVTLVTGSEESGVLGMRAFLDRHDTRDWIFINFDGVGADAPLRVLSREGGPLTPVDGDPRLLELAAGIGRSDPELAAEPLAHGSGLPYDSTPILAGGGRAISVVNQEGAIPDYHWPTDRIDRISPSAFERAVRFGRRLIREIDRAG